MYKIHTLKGVKYITLDEFSAIPFLRHAYSTKVGGVSPKEGYDGLNLGFSTKDSRENIVKNYELLCDAINIPIEDLVLSNQIHDDKIIKVTKDDRGKGIFIDSDLSGVDGLVTNEMNTALTLFSADCVLVMAVDKVNKVIGACHAGWKGTVKAITGKLIQKMCDELNAERENILACICPGIGPCCFEVKEDVCNHFKKTFSDFSDIISTGDNEKYFINLWKANEKLLLKAGIRQENIYFMDLCTSCNSDLFYSYRKQGSGAGRMAAVIEMR